MTSFTDGMLYGFGVILISFAVGYAAWSLIFDEGDR